MGIGDLGLYDFRLLSSMPIFMSPYTGRFKRVSLFDCCNQYVVWEGTYLGCF